MRLPLLLLSGIFSATTCLGQAKEIAPADVAKALGGPDLYVFDCNEADMYAEAHVPGANLLVYDAVTPDKLPADRNATLVFYCYSPECPAARTAAETAVELGFGNVFYMLAGITGWQDAGLPTEP